ncbi:heavy-metal-associated domain-containing protein [Tumebacillus lipolyticus]|uniref:Heavy-metal-associated domain-containing protein n=1 Tax=Tumebacillus lipolyticus TaxID=1280370 RepID=A0ABW4ZZG4_9BACL
MSIAHIMIKKASPDEFRRVSTSLNSLLGVDYAKADPGNLMITVEYEDHLVNVNQLRKTVQAAGIQVLSDWKEKELY